MSKEKGLKSSFLLGPIHPNTAGQPLVKHFDVTDIVVTIDYFIHKFSFSFSSLSFLNSINPKEKSSFLYIVTLFPFQVFHVHKWPFSSVSDLKA